MRVVTIVSLAASAVLGLGAIFVAKLAIPNAQQAKAAGVPHEAAGAPMVVAAHPLKFGDRLDAGALTVIKVPANAIPQGAFSAVDQVLSADHGTAPVVLTPLAQHEALLPAKISGPGARPTVAAEIADGMRAYSFKVTDATGVGGHALPGDRVDVVLLRDLTPQGPERTWISYVIVQNARVLGVDLNADPASDKPASPNTATLEVSVQDAQKLSVASTLGTLSLALRKTGQVQVADAAPLRTGDFLGGGPRAAGGPARASGGGTVRVSAGIVIVEGVATKRGGSSGRKGSGGASGGQIPSLGTLGADAAGAGGKALKDSGAAASALGAVG